MRNEFGYVRSLDESFQDVLAPCALIVGLTFLAVGWSRSYIPDSGFRTLTIAEITAGLALLPLAAWCRDRRFTRRRGFVVGTLILAPLVINNLLFFYEPRAAQHTFGLYIAVVAAGILPFARRWFVGITGSALAVWCFAVARSSGSLIEWIEPGGVMLSMVALGSALHVWCRRFARRMDALRIENDRLYEARALFETHYRDITELANDPITEIDESGRIIYANPAHQGILGFRPDEMIGYSVLNLLQPGEPISETFARPPHKRVLVAPHADGGERTLECNIRPIELDSGERRLLVTTRDVTERVASERALEAGRVELEALVEERTSALRSSLAELQRADRLASMGTLAAGIAHQINNPVGSIQMSAELALLSEGDSDERDIWRGALENGVEQAKRCGEIVSSMLQFARNEPTARFRQDLAELVLRVCSQSESYARSRLAIIDTRGVDGPLPIHASAIEIEQALLNIVRNATESSPDPVHVQVRTRRIDGFAEVTISDDGNGMADDEVEHAFDPFFTTRLQRGGTGLGLSVAHGVITDHDGVLSIESRLGRGTSIVLRLPLSEPIDRCEKGETR